LKTLEEDIRMEKIVREVDLFIFDLDGTLADSKDDIKAAINHALKSFGMKTLTDAEITFWTRPLPSPASSRRCRPSQRGRRW